LNKSFVLLLFSALGLLLSVGGMGVLFNSKKIKRGGLLLTSYRVSAHYFPTIIIAIGLIMFIFPIIMLILK
jgi:hypothetical protein